MILRRCQGLYRPQKISELIRQIVSAAFEKMHLKRQLLIINYGKYNRSIARIDGVVVINISTNIISRIV